MKGTKKLIDAEALTALMSMLADDPWNADVHTTWAKAYSYVIELISEQEVFLELNKDITQVFVRGVEYVPVTEQKWEKWIPVTERLPECGIDVLTDNGYGEYEINHTIGGGWYWEPVAAWMPLPKPWKGEEG